MSNEKPHTISDNLDNIEQMIEPASSTDEKSPEAVGADALQTSLWAEDELLPGEQTASDERGAEEEIIERPDGLKIDSEGVRQRQLIAVASGKGGAGKSMVAASMGIFLAQLGRKVTIVDAHFDSANLHTFLGLEEHQRSLQSFFRKEVKHLEELAVPTSIPGLRLIPSCGNSADRAIPTRSQRERFIANLRELSADYVILDLGAGCGAHVLDLALAADQLIVLTTPEPTAVESAFRLMKGAFIRKIQGLEGLAKVLDDLRGEQEHFGLTSPRQIYELARGRNLPCLDELHLVLANFRPRLLVNMTRTRDDLELGPSLTIVGRRHLGLPIDYLGYVENDDLVWVTVRKRRPMLVDYPEAKVAKDIERLVRRLMTLEAQEQAVAVENAPLPTPMVKQTHYEILGVHPGATEEEVRRAQRRMRRIYNSDSAVIYGVVPTAEVAKMHLRIEEAYSILVDPEKRHYYDQNIFPEVSPSELADIDRFKAPVINESISKKSISEAPPSAQLQIRPQMPFVDGQTLFTGLLLRQIREARGEELSDIAERTKIHIAYLRAIEEENFANAPAMVYLRGFIKTVARHLRLDAEQVARTYMLRYEQAKSERA